MAAVDRIVIESDPETKKKLKEISVFTGCSMKDIITEFIEEKHKQVIEERFASK